MNTTIIISKELDRFFYDSGKIIVLASAFIKKGRKTPESAIRKALQVRAGYMKQTRQI